MKVEEGQCIIKAVFKVSSWIVHISDPSVYSYVTYQFCWIFYLL